MGTARHYGVVDAVKAWESEKPNYRGQPLGLSNSADIGHYTQMVWRHSKQIGCAKAECRGNLIVVCNYDPPGNVLGQKPY
jgi:pathogenesis-related protein 1